MQAQPTSVSLLSYAVLCCAVPTRVVHKPGTTHAVHVGWLGCLSLCLGEQKLNSSVRVAETVVRGGVCHTKDLCGDEWGGADVSWLVWVCEWERKCKTQLQLVTGAWTCSASSLPLFVACAI